jgi:hypothetical protein
MIMNAHRIETVLNQDRTLNLVDLPFHAGDAVEVTILSRRQKPAGQKRYPLHGSRIKYTSPTDPVAEEEAGFWTTSDGRPVDSRRK